MSLAEFCDSCLSFSHIVGKTCHLGSYSSNAGEHEDQDVSVGLVHGFCCFADVVGEFQVFNPIAERPIP